jgi:hypothetical protein
MTQILTSYVDWVKAMPIISAMIQFAILGTLGEVISRWIRSRSFRYPFNLRLTLWKMFVWALLAIGIKYAFKGFTGFVEYLEDHAYLGELSSLGRAFAISAFMNLQFGLTLVLAHRALDNLPEKQKNWQNLDKSIIFACLVLDTSAYDNLHVAGLYRIGLAALWSVALGIILGFFGQKKSELK